MKPALRMCECRSTIGEIHDESDGRIRVVFKGRRPIDYGIAEFANYRTGAPPQSDPKKLKPWTSHIVTLRCYRYPRHAEGFTIEIVCGGTRRNSPFRGCE